MKMANPIAYIPVYQGTAEAVSPCITEATAKGAFPSVTEAADATAKCIIYIPYYFQGVF